MDLAIRRIAAIAALLLAACSQDDRGRPRWVLAGDGSASQPASTASLASDEVGDERRPVLREARSESLALTTVSSAASSEPVQVDLHLPESMRGAVVSLSGRWIPIAGEAARALLTGHEDLRRALAASALSSPVRVEPASLRAADDVVRVRVDLPEAARGKLGLLELSGTALPEAPFTSPAIAIPPGAHLRFGMGLRGAVADGLPVSFVIEVLGAEDGPRADASSPIEVFRETLAPASGEAGGGWLDRDIDLDPYGGRTVRLRFSNPPPAIPADGAPRAIPLWSDPAIVPPPVPAAADERRNLLLISLDTLRGDHVGSYRYRRPTTPTIDARLAAEGVLFEQAFAPAPHTAPSHASMLSGVDPCVHGVAITGAAPLPALPPNVLTLAEILHSAGYLTAAFTEDGYVTASLGFARGFESFTEVRAPRLTGGEVERTFARGLEWVRAHGDRPWFLFLHTYQVHEPYDPPPGYEEEVAWNAGRGAAAERAALYDGEIRYTDDVLARLFAGLEADGVLDRTVVVLTADHGEQFGEHGAFRHDNTVYDAALRIPLIVRAPGLLPRGRRVAAPATLIDVVPTALALLGVPIPDSVQGWNLVPAARGDPVASRILYATLPRKGLEAIRTPARKLIVDHVEGRRQAFDWQADPGEERDLAAEVPDADWDAAEEAHRRRCSAALARLPALPAGGSRASEIEPAVREKLRALGYAD